VGGGADDPAELPDDVRRRLDAVFGDVLPEITRDEVAEGADDARARQDDEWLRANRPPHHDRD
jgi:hypothetical protein